MPKMIKNIFKNFVTKSATRPYPIKVRPGFKNARGELTNKVQDCIFCSICARKCPSQCIRVDKKTQKWECDVSACVLCGICEEVCPKKCVTHHHVHRKPYRDHVTMHLQKDEYPKIKVVRPPQSPAA